MHKATQLEKPERLNKALGYRSAPGTVVLTGPLAR